MYVSVNKNAQITYETPADAAGNYPGTGTAGSFYYLITGTLPGGQTRDAFTLEIKISPCAPPTVFNPPSVSDQTYTLGEATQTYNIGPFTNTNSASCLASAYTHTAAVSPSPATAVTFSADNLGHYFSSSDVNDAGGVGSASMEYTITLTVVISGC